MLLVLSILASIILLQALVENSILFVFLVIGDWIIERKKEI